MRAVFVLLTLALAAYGQVNMTLDEPFGPDLQIREFRVPTADTPSLTIFVRNKYLVEGANGVGQADKTILFVAGATYPTSSAFDLELDGFSWMDYMARDGYDVWMFDQRGYGRSDRPPQMDVFPSGNCDVTAPICNTSTVANDVHTIVEYIRSVRGISAINIAGWSWGTSIMSLYTSRYPETVNKLILYSPQWTRAANAAPTACYRTVNRATALARWLNRVPPSEVDTLIPSPWFDIWWNTTVALDPVGFANGVVRAPNGISVDNSVYWGNGIPVYDITRLNMPVLIVHGTLDVDLPVTMTYGVWYNLTSTGNKRWVEISGATHTIVMEKNRMQLFMAVQNFLNEQMPPMSESCPGYVSPPAPLVTNIQFTYSMTSQPIQCMVAK